MYQELFKFLYRYNRKEKNGKDKIKEVTFIETILIILSIVIIIQIIVIILFFSEIVLNIEKCEIIYNEKQRNKLLVNDLKMNVEVIIFRKLKILKIKINKEYCEILKLKFKMNAIKKLKDKKDTSLGFILKNIDKIKPNIKKFDLNLSVGTQDMIITIFLIPTLSTAVSIFVSKYFSENKNNNFYMKINPNFLNINNFSLKLTTTIKLNTLRTLFFIIKHRKIKR